VFFLLGIRGFDEIVHGDAVRLAEIELGILKRSPCIACLLHDVGDLVRSLNRGDHAVEAASLKRVEPIANLVKPTLCVLHALQCYADSVDARI